MCEIVDLLKEKNSCLEKFYNLNKKEMMSFIEGNFDNLEDFYNSREGILDMIRRVDEMIEIASLDFQESAEVSNKEVTKEISIALNMRDRMIEQILEQDLEIISTIDDAKSMKNTS